MSNIDGLKSHKLKMASQDSEIKVVVKNTTGKKRTTKQMNINKKPAGSLAKPIKVNNYTEDFEESVEDDRNEEKFDFDLTEEDITEEMEIVKKNFKNAKKKDKPEKKPKKDVSVARKVVSVVLLVLVLGAIGVVCWGFVWGNELIMKITNGNGNLLTAIKTITTEERVELKTDENGRTNVLIFGTSGMDMDGTSITGSGSHAGSSLTDTIMVISYDQKTQDIAMFSLPRDLKAEDTCTATGKINEVFWCNNISGNNEATGAQALMDEMKTIFGVDIQYYVHVNWGSLISIVDAVGGIDVVLDEDISDYYYTGAVYEAGVEYHLDGAAALGLARARHGTTSGDFSRANSQQKIIIALKNKLVNQGVDMLTAVSLVNDLGDNLRTNVSIEEIKTVAYNAADMDFDNIRQISLLKDEDGNSYMTTGTLEVVSGGTTLNISYVFPTEGVGIYNKLKKYIKQQLQNPESLVETTEDNTTESEYLYKDY